eukprot:363702-Chlamydomonas_euryale.AAC.1
MAGLARAGPEPRASGTVEGHVRGLAASASRSSCQGSSALRRGKIGARTAQKRGGTWHHGAAADVRK